jgi:hypothetical protein
MGKEKLLEGLKYMSKSTAQRRERKWYLETVLTQKGRKQQIQICNATKA